MFEIAIALAAFGFGTLFGAIAGRNSPKTVDKVIQELKVAEAKAATTLGRITDFKSN